MSTTAGEIPGVGEVAGEAEATSEGEVASKVVGRTIAAVAGSLASSPCSGCSQGKPNTRHQWVVNWRFPLVIRLLGAFGDGASCLARRG